MQCRPREGRGTRNRLSEPTSDVGCSQLFTWVTVKSMSTAVASNDQVAAFRSEKGGSSRKPSSLQSLPLVQHQCCQRRSLAKIALSSLTVYLMLRKQGVKQKLR